jgi:hypothetical protein
LDRLVAEAGRWPNTSRKWFSEFNVVEAELARLSSPDGMKEPAYKALKIQRSGCGGICANFEIPRYGFLNIAR